jgi:hypothetical protein
MREILGRRAKTEKKLHQSRRRGCVLWSDALNRPLDRGQEQRRCRTEVGYDIFSLPETDVTSVDPARISPSFIPGFTRPDTDSLTTLYSTVLQTGPLLHRWESRQRCQGTFGLTSLCSLLVHDTVSTFPAANGLARLDVIFGTTIFRTLLTYGDIRVRNIMLLTSTQVLHLLPRRR